jgi:hypothetical protein
VSGHQLSDVVSARASAFGLAIVPDGPQQSIAELGAACCSALIHEFNPVGILETLMVRGLARRVAIALHEEQEFTAQPTEQAVAAILRAPSAETPSFVEVFTNACAAERREALCRSAARNSIALVRELRELHELQRQRWERRAEMTAPDPRFLSEIQCLAYLHRRFRAGACQCRQCGAAGRGSWIAARHCWQCAECNTQTGIRHGTVFAHSHVTLVRWFHAVGFVLSYPGCTARELAEATRIRRRPTVRGMLKKIRAALEADNASQLLAGLDEAYLQLT